MQNLICIKTYTNRIEAEIGKGLLEAYGIKAIVSADDCGGAKPELIMGSGGVKLLVDKKDYLKAVELLSDGKQ